MTHDLDFDGSSVSGGSSKDDVVCSLGVQNLSCVFTKLWSSRLKSWALAIETYRQSTDISVAIGRALKNLQGFCLLIMNHAIEGIDGATGDFKLCKDVDPLGGGFGLEDRFNDAQ